MAELTVLGIGNILMGDEGVGVRLLEAVRDARGWPAGVEFIDGGVAGLGLLNVIEQAGRLIVFDAAEMKLPAGEFRIIGPSQLSVSGPERRISMHDVPFAETLKLCRRSTGTADFVQMLVVQPKTVDFQGRLSAELTAAMDRLVRAAVALVEQTARDAGVAAESPGASTD